MLFGEKILISIMSTVDKRLKSLFIWARDAKWRTLCDGYGCFSLCFVSGKTWHDRQ